jgi:hypothetical protein
MSPLVSLTVPMTNVFSYGTCFEICFTLNVCENVTELINTVNSRQTRGYIPRKWRVLRILEELHIVWAFLTSLRGEGVLYLNPGHGLS